MIPSLTCPAAPYQGVRTWAMSTGLGPLFDFMDRFVNAQSSERIAMEQGLTLLEKSVRWADDNKTMHATKRKIDSLRGRNAQVMCLVCWQCRAMFSDEESPQEHQSDHYNEG